MTSSDFISMQLNQYKDTALYIGSANYPFPQTLKSRQYPFDMNAAEYTVGNRLFPGCEILDEIETQGNNYALDFLHLSDEYETILSIYSGTQANQVVYNAILNPGDRIIAFSESSGGHASHLSFLKKYYQVIEYSFNFNTGIDYNVLEVLVEKHKPKLLIAGSTLYPEGFDYSQLKTICKTSKTLLLADISHTALYVATGAHPPVNEYADFITYTTHKTTRGMRSAILHYKKEFKDKILSSLCSISQGAPKYSDILANTIMFEELKKTDIKEYQRKVFSYSDQFRVLCKEYNLKTIGTGNSHLMIIELSETPFNGEDIKNIAAQNNIFITNHLTKQNEYIRLGFLTSATLSMEFHDFIYICEIFLRLIRAPHKNCKEDVSQIMRKYTNRFYKENYNL